MRRENSKPSAVDEAGQLVSIRSRRNAAGECPSMGAIPTKPRSFNPLPPQCGGRIRGRQSQGQRHQVSIRSRRNAAGEYTNGEYDAHRILFQSAPAAMRRENARRLKVVQAELTFQSAPAAMRRENMPPTRKCQAKKFQSAPAAMRRENGFPSSRGPRDKSFNPLPPQCGGRIPSAPPIRRAFCGFNPLPPQCGGRIPIRSKASKIRPRFNPLPPQCGGRIGLRAPWPWHFAGRFNPLPPQCGGRISV